MSFRHFFISLFFTIVLMAFVACRVYDKPPSLKTPAPPPLNGVFVNGKDTLWMNGDGKTIRWHFENALPKIGQSGRGEYVFLFSHGQYRYDAAENFRIIDTAHGNASCEFGVNPGGTPEGFTIIRYDQNSKVQYFKKVKDN